MWLANRFAQTPSAAIRANWSSPAICTCCSVWRWSGQGDLTSAASSASSVTSDASSPLVWMCICTRAAFSASITSKSCAGGTFQIPLGCPPRCPGHFSRAVNPWIDPSVTILTEPSRSMSEDRLPSACARATKSAGDISRNTSVGTMRRQKSSEPVIRSSPSTSSSSSIAARSVAVVTPQRMADLA